MLTLRTASERVGRAAEVRRVLSWHVAVRLLGVRLIGVLAVRRAAFSDLAGLVTAVLIFSSIAVGFDTSEKFFEAKIRPLLLDRCIPCHGGLKPDGGLSLESRDGWESRDVIAPGDPEQSLLMKVVRSQDPKVQMPPADSGVERLTVSQLQDLETWIRDGAIDPRNALTTSNGPKRRSREFQITQEDLSHWAYQPIPISSQGSNSDDLNSSHAVAARLDQLVDLRLHPLGIYRAAQATPRELVRRAYFDLWGLPPEPQAVAAFELNPSEASWLALIDRLLASPHYGQRWGRFWLDWVRYAETNGYERDGIKPHAWRYRDYVIRSFNSDKPYDRFLMEQLAGDQLIAAENIQPDKQSAAWKDAIIATGYFRLHVWDDEPDDSEAAEMDDLDDVMVTTGAAIMGITLGCARCHDHKFDPLSQVDYYSMLDLLRDIDPYGLPKKGGGGRGTGQIERWLCSPEELAQWQSEKAIQIQQLEAADDKQPLQQKLQQLKESLPPFEKALAIQQPSVRKPTHVLARGDHQSAGPLVESDVPLLFRIKGKDQGAQRISTRLELAKWLTARENPLTARVLANRIWLNHFGAGIVPTPDDFGYTGIAPSNPELLDHLAAELIRSGWSIKSLHRSILLSQTYRSSSSIPHSDNSATESDPDNRLFGRQNLRRLDAEAIRDSMLFYAGSLHAKSEGPSVYTTLSDEIRDTANPVSLSSWVASPEDEQDCRSVFLVVKRSLKDPLLESFDFANSHSPVGQRPVTTVAPQALMLLNDRFVKKQAERLARRLIGASDDPAARIEYLWQILFQRKPTSRELAASAEFVQQQLEQGRLEIAVWTSLSRAILNSNECLFID